MSRKLWWWSVACAAVLAYGTVSCGLYAYRVAYFGMSDPPWWQIGLITGLGEQASDFSNQITSILPGVDPTFRFESMTNFTWPMLLTLWIALLIIWFLGFIFFRIGAKSRSTRPR